MISIHDLLVFGRVLIRFHYGRVENLWFELVIFTRSFLVQESRARRQPAMGAVRWTWSELADMHLCLGAARAAGGDAEEAKRLYEENHPDRGVPEHGVFIAVDLSLRTMGRLL